MCKIYQEKFVVRRNNKIAPDAISDVNKYNLVYNKNNCRSNKNYLYT